MAISFNTIPSTGRVPFFYAEFDSSLAQGSGGALAYKTLLIGQGTSEATASANELYTVTSKDSAKVLFGKGSELARMVEAAIAGNSRMELGCVMLAAGAGAAATATLTASVGETGVSAGTARIYVGGRRVVVGIAAMTPDAEAETPVTAADIAASVATAIAEAINADGDLPVTAAASDAVVTLTAKCAGEAGNGIDLRVGYYSGEELPAGLTVTPTAFTGGSGAPDVTDAFAAIGDEWYQLIACPYADAANLAVIKTEMADRDDCVRQIGGAVIVPGVGDLSALQTLGAAQNSRHIVVIPCHGVPTAPDELVAEVAVVVAGAAETDPARPFQTLPLSNAKAAVIGDRFTMAEREILLKNGVATIVSGNDGVVRLERIITTYRTNASGGADTAWLDLTTLLTLEYIRWNLRNTFQTKYPRHKLADDDARFGAGQAVITPKIAKAECVALFGTWEEKGLVEGIDRFKADLVVERNASDPNRLDFLLTPDLINQFIVGAAKIAFVL